MVVMPSPKRAPSASKQVDQRREWIASREALRLVSEAYALHDTAEYETTAKRHHAAMAKAADALMRRLTEGSLLARPVWYRFVQGNHDNGEEHLIQLQEQDRAISPNFWRNLQRLRRSADIDWIAGDFSFEDNDAGVYATGSANSVKFDRSGLPAIDRLTSKPPSNPSGAPRKWDWDGALLHLAALAHGSPDGLFRDDGKDPNQSDIARHLRAWFIDTHGDAPETSQLRDYGKRFMAELNAVKLQGANNLRHPE
ncbi:hypothetical protein [Novosphingobium sp. FKTRR1]|uniref:hypothetical protein n=1 Tax=Novosphingobium sp. FKTRR1 TaxID=2879118 RepID=UPI001CF0ABE6|nr:hypothetical protein [Novosphingobium sp. FKTRR1]